MAKAKKEKDTPAPEPVETGKFLNKEEYFEWRTTIAEMQVEEAKLREYQLQLQNLDMQADIQKLRAQIYRVTIVKNAQETAVAAKAEYRKYKSELEARLGISLSGKTIHDVTYEILDLSDEKETQGSNK